VLAGAGAVVVALVIVPALAPHEAPAGLILQGVEFGSISGLLAIGLVLTYRSTRIINFAYGAMGGMSGTIGVMLDLGQHWNWFLAVAAGLAVGGLLGAAVDILVIRRFFNAPRLILTVATIGLAQILGGLQLLVPQWLGGPPIVGGVTTPLSGPHIQVHPVIFNGNDLLVACVVPVVLVGLGWFLLRTDAGVAVRSVSDNAERAMLLGIPVRRLSTLVWVIAGVLSALTILVSAPSQGLTLTAGAGPTLLLLPLAAAVVARMESLPIAFGAGIGIGIIDQVVQFNVSKESVTTVVNFAVVLVALLLQRRTSGRAEDAEGSWLATGVLKPVPAALRRLPEVVTGRAVLGAAVAGVVVGAPYVLGVGATLQFSFALVLGMVAVSLVVLSGWTGSISLGQFAFAGVGGVVAGDLVSRYNVDIFIAIAAGAAAGALLAVPIGYAGLRIRGEFLAVITLAMAVMMDSFFFNPTNFESLLPSTIVRPVLWKRFDLSSVRANYFFCLALLVIVIVFVKGLRQARAGRVFLATRDNPRASQAMAVPKVRVKLVGFVLAGCIAGVAGALFAFTLGSVGSHTFDPSTSVLVFAMAVIGGLGSISGALMGVALIEVLSHAFPQYYFIITGAGLLWILSALPGGLGEGLQRLRDLLLRLVANRRGLLVPSLVADRRAAGSAHAPHEEAILAGALAGGVDRPPGGADDGEGHPAPVTPAEVVAEAAGVVAAAAGVVDDGVPPMLRCRAVEVSYGPVQVLFGVDLDVRRGEVVALLGTNGAGKSTLLKGVCGLLKVAGGGDVELGGDRITNAAPETMARRGVSLMPGGRGVFPTLTVEENLRLGAWLVRRDRARVAGTRRQSLEMFPALEKRLGQLAGNLSGGEQQMLSLAMALMVDPELLLIDELSLGLAPTVVSQLLDVVRALHDGGTTIVVVEQSVNVALELAERAVFLEKGEVRFSGPTADLLGRPDILRSVFIAGAGSVTGADADGVDAAAPVAGTPRHARPADRTALPSPAAAANGAGAPPPGAVAPAARRAPGPDDPVVLECREVSKTFGGIRAVSEVSLTLHQGEILGLIGHNGAGKTTLFDMVSGFLALDGGRILLGGMDIGEWPAHLRAAAGIGRTFQEARLFPSLTVAETVAVALERHLASKDLVAAGLRLPACLDSEAEVAGRVDELVGAMGLEAFREKLVGELSTGTRRIVELACVLAQDPAVVLLDEPSGGVAQRETEALGPLLRRVQEHSGCSLLVIEHDMPLLRAVCDRMIALELGEVIAAGTPAEVLEHEAVVRSYLGTDATAIERSGARAG
jgi:ABC-type branched-subunit amino acid transport system ATPase component/ABC-type branched-subunit amino acid transport system permease subunit